MNIFEYVKDLSFEVVFIYGILLSLCPDLFLGSFIYREDVWKNFVPKEQTSKQVLDHILTGLGYTWVAWSIMYYLDTTDEMLFAQYNVVIWTMFSILDMVTRIRGLYSPIASMVNLAIVNCILAGWIVCIV